MIDVKGSPQSIPLLPVDHDRALLYMANLPICHKFFPSVMITFPSIMITSSFIMTAFLSI